jgi:hypothetical protein
LRECRDHLADAAADKGEQRAVEQFGAAVEIAAAFDREVAARLGVRATLATVVALVGMAESTIAVIHSASAGVTAQAGWAVAFFVAAQLSAVAGALAAIQALVLRATTVPPEQIGLLARRNGCALTAAGATMFSAAAALPGHGPAALLLVGPALAAGAAFVVLRARSLARRLGAAGDPAWRSPLDDLGRLVRVGIGPVRPGHLLAATTLLAAAAAFARDRGEDATVGAALITSGIEAGAVVVCFLLLGPALGLRRRGG